MSVTSPAASPQKRNGRRPPRQAPPERSGDSLAVVPPPPTTREILLGATACEPLSPADLTLALGRNERGSRLLAAAAILQCTGQRRVLAAFLSHESLQAEFKSIKGTTLLNAAQKTRRATPVLEKIATVKTDAAIFGPILEEVSRAENRFEASYIHDGKTDLRGIAALYDRTDEQAHPVLRALPPAAAYEDDLRRRHIVKADRLIRFMLDEIPPEPTPIPPPQNQVAA